MNRETVSELLSVVKLDTGAATKEARAWADKLRGLEGESRKLADANKVVGETTDKLRGEMLRLRKEEAAGTLDKKAFAAQTKAVRISMAEQQEAARKLKEETKRLREEERQLTAMQRAGAKAAAEAAKVRGAAAREAAKAEAAAARDAAKARSTSAKEAARAEIAAIRDTSRAAKEAEANRLAIPRLRGRNDAMAHQERGNFRKMQASGERIGALQESLSAGDRRLSQLNRPLGGIRTAISDRASSMMGRVRETIEDPSAFASAAGSKFAGGVGAIGRSAMRIGGAGVLGAAGIAGGIASKGGDFEALRASLETVEGSASKAASTFKLIQSFAAKTPYGVEETTNALLKLKARGLDASLPSLLAYGDTASAMGKSLDQMIEAVTDATSGEFERLKEFGVKAKTEGDQVKLTFKGVTTTVQKDAQSIQGYLVALGKTNFAGGMERQSRTLNGMMSSLGDSVSQLADTAFQNGLGDALKEIVADLTGAAGSGEEFAKVLGRTLGDAVRGTYKFVKELIGPMDELPGKLDKAASFVSSLASGLKGIVDVGMRVADTLGPANTALFAMGVAATAALGPIGLLLAAGVGLSKAFSAVRDSFMNAGTALEDFKRKQKELEESDRKNIQTRQSQENASRLERSNEALDRRAGADKAAAERLKAARLRALGKDETQLTEAERKKLANDMAIVGFKASQAGKNRMDGGAESERAVDQLVGGEERSADAAEIGRLKRKKRLTGSEKKRLAALSRTYDLETGKGGGKKAKDDAFDESRKKEIDDLVKKAELEAGDKALASGNAAGASEAARSAGKETRTRLTEMARNGALPGEVERSLLRAAGFEDVKNAPPPPVIITNQKFEITVTVPLETVIHTGENPEDVVNDISAQLTTTLERDVVPKVLSNIASSLKR